MAELNLALLSAYVIAVLFLLLTPGPVVLLVTGTAARVGYTRAFLTLLGTNLASLVSGAAGHRRFCVYWLGSGAVIA